ncbi:reverse transcriptase [Phytophthora megakarya]|uniref:Reverse transcriptase n=1 Tax=Phytophthora megakarya TaxID=4795 RepID=A0A225VMH1_9STRA|nr:reverse transcriptase [Phytophthora megakarya]
MTVFQRNIPMPSHIGPVLGRSTYIDDIAHGAKTWNQLCDDLDALLYRLRYWNISVSLPKSEIGKRSIPYLSLEISAEGIRATPKVPKGVMDLPFPKSHKGVLSFLGSLNYYHKFIEDFLVVAAVLYELSEDQMRQGRDISRAHESFELLKRKIVATPMLRHPDIQKPFVVIPHANRWVAGAVIGQEYNGRIQFVRYTGRVLNDAELRYHIAEKEVIAILKTLQVVWTILEGRQLIIYARYSVLKWVLQSKSADGRCVPWGVTLSHWDIEIRKVQKVEDGLAAIMGAGITPREHLDEAVETLIPLKGYVRRHPVVSVEMLGSDFQGVVLSFDAAAKLSTKKGSCGCLPGWKVLKAKGFLLENVTVNDAEYHGLLKGLEMAIEMRLQALVAVRNSRIVLQQVQRLINCNQPHLKKHFAKVELLKEKFGSLRLIHLKREYNLAADYLTTKTLSLDESWGVTDPAEIAHLEHV